MTEAEWRWCRKPQLLLAHILDRASRRKLRLFAHACCLRVGTADGRETWRRVVELLERSADDEVPPNELDAVLSGARRDPAHAAVYACWVADARAGNYYFPAIAHNVIVDIIRSCQGRNLKHVRKAEQQHQARLLDDIFGPLPFRPVPVDPTWLTPTAVAIARGIYAERAFERLPILADALEEAGCDHPDVLTHCRDDSPGAGPHVRGCWVVDLVLGKN